MHEVMHQNECVKCECILQELEHRSRVMLQSDTPAVDTAHGSVQESSVSVGSAPAAAATDHLTCTLSDTTSSSLAQTTGARRQNFSVMIPVRPSRRPQSVPACHEPPATEHHSAITPASQTQSAQLAVRLHCPSSSHICICT